MRSRPELTVYLDPPKPRPGQRLSVRVVLNSKSSTPFDAVDVSFAGNESRYKRTVSSGKSSRRVYHRRAVCRLGARFEGGTLEPGVWERSLTIDVPPDAPPTYRSALAHIDYTLQVRVHIPWWPDRSEQYPVQVLPAVYGGAPATRTVHTTQEGQYRGDDPVIELSLDKSQLSLGGTLTGAVAITDLKGRKLRRIELALCAIESPRVYSSAGPREVDRRTWALREGAPDEGSTVPFTVKIPDDVAGSFASPFIAVEHVLEVVAVVAFGRDLSLRVPVTVGSFVEPAAAPAQGAPLLGRARHVAVWREAASRAHAYGIADATFDPEQGRVFFNTRGVEVNVTEENRDGVGPCLVASLAWPSLGLGLGVAERGWTDFGQKPAGVYPPMLEHFTVRGREPAQIAGLLDQELFSTLELVEEAGMSDEGAVLLRKGGVYQVEGLERFLSLVHAFAALLSRRAGAVPPPAALAPHRAAWERFARDQGAELRVGDLSLHDWGLNGVALTVVHEWDGPAPKRTQITAELPEGRDPAALEKSLARATDLPVWVRANVVGTSLETAADPERLRPIAQRFSAGLATLLGLGTVAPYR